MAGPDPLFRTAMLVPSFDDTISTLTGRPPSGAAWAYMVHKERAAVPSRAKSRMLLTRQMLSDLERESPVTTSARIRVIQLPASVLEVANVHGTHRNACRCAVLCGFRHGARVPTHDSQNLGR